METVLNALIQILAFAAIALVGAFTVATGSPPMPSSTAARAAALDLLPEDRQGVILELGSGCGGWARALAERHPRSEVIGFERSPLPWLVSRLWLAFRPLPNLLIVRGDIFDAPLEDAGVVTCYLVGPIMARLSPVLARRLRPGTLVVSVVFALPRWTPLAQCDAGDLFHSTVYLYRIPDSLPPDGPA